MKVAIIGSRNFKNKNFLCEKMKEVSKENNISLIISGGAKGADTMGVQWANKNKIETKVFSPDFKKHKRAYHFRNRQIVLESDLIIAFWDGHSTGTKYTINYAKTLNKNIIVFKY